MVYQLHCCAKMDVTIIKKNQQKFSTIVSVVLWSTFVYILPVREGHSKPIVSRAHCQTFVNVLPDLTYRGPAVRRCKQINNTLLVVYYQSTRVWTDQ